jgi:hypothetical protein
MREILHRLGIGIADYVVCVRLAGLRNGVVSSGVVDHVTAICRGAPGAVALRWVHWKASQPFAEVSCPFACCGDICVQSLLPSVAQLFEGHKEEHSVPAVECLGHKYRAPNSETVLVLMIGSPWRPIRIGIWIVCVQACILKEIDTLPCSVFVPDFVVRLIWPTSRPYSAE